MSRGSETLRSLAAARSLTRRGFVRLLGAAGGSALLPLNFSCGAQTRVVDSTYVPTPEAPLTPTSEFYVNYNFGQPDVPPASSWKLRLRGLVKLERDLTFDDLMSLEQVTREITLECIGNSPGGGLISSAAFTGVRLRDVVAEAGIGARARGLHLLGLDGYPAYLPIALAEQDEALLVHTINDEPLPAVHGAPVRALFPGRYGMFSVKWLDSITLARTYHTFGALRGLSPAVAGETDVKSAIHRLREGSVVTVGESMELTGIAVTPGVGITRVEVDTGDGWEPAEIAFNLVSDARNPYLWSLWRYRWTPRETGRAVVSVRAFDTDGRTQSTEARFPYDSTAIHSVPVLVRG